MTLACALGVRVTEVSADWRAFLKHAQPWSLVLFHQACKSPAQVRKLCDDLREAAQADLIIYIDQEGGRVARMKPPLWPVWPSGAEYGRLYAKDQQQGLEACRLGHRLIAHELRAVGVNGDYVPVLDVPVPGADPIIGDRALGRDPETIIALGRAALAGLHDGGVAGCIKHMPGHGRATADSHLKLPIITEGPNELGADFAPFRALNDAEMAMTAHIVFTAIDPDRPGTHSPKMIEMIRKDIGFSGLLVTDDLDMHALSGPVGERAAKAFAAGVDIALQCNGVIADMEDVIAVSPKLTGASLQRAQKVEAYARAKPGPFDAAEAWWRLRTLMGPGVGMRLA